MLEVLDLCNRRVPMVACPECNSTNISRKGFANGKQRFRCEDCGRYFIEGSSLKKKITKLPTVVKECPYCKSTEIKRDGLTSTGKQQYKCLTCTKVFGTKEVGHLPVTYKCPYCGGELKEQA